MSQATSGPVATGASYVQRAISVTIQLGKGSFGDGGFNTVKLAGLRTTATIKRQGLPGFDTASVRIYGVTESVMNQVSTLGAPIPMERLNNVIVEAGDAVSGMAVVYQGNINNAWQELDGAPDTYLTIDSLASTFAAMQPAPPISFEGAADVPTIISGIASRLGRGFVNSGVQGTLASPYFAGTGLEQAYNVARAANIELYDDGDTFFIWPRTGSRGGAIPLVSVDSGLIGYPKYTSQGIRLQTLYNPSIRFGGLINLKTSVMPANGVWYVNELTLNLSAQLHDGPWFCDVGAVRQVGAPVA